MTVSHLRSAERTPLSVSRGFSWRAICRVPGESLTCKPLVPGGTFLLNTPYSKDEVWSKLPTPLQETLIARKANFT